VWSVFQEKMPMLTVDLKVFATVENFQNVPMHNSRPAQLLNGRRVDLVDNWAYCSKATPPAGTLFTG